jgi:Mrp family chromosome partitioning ATPase
MEAVRARPWAIGCGAIVGVICALRFEQRPAIGAVCGAVVGAVLVTAVATRWPGPMGPRRIQHALAVPVTGTMKRIRTVQRAPFAAIETLPGEAVRFIDDLCVAAEQVVPTKRSLTVAVAGTRVSAGVTTLALAMAGRLARNGATVLLVDADVRHPDVTAAFGADDGGIPTLLGRHEERSVASGEAPGSHRRRVIGPRHRQTTSKTGVRHINVLGIGDRRESRALRRSTVDALIDATSAEADVVVFDAGSLLDSSVAARLCRVVDVVVLAVPRNRQSARDLRIVASHLKRRQGTLLPVLTVPRRRRSAGRRRKSTINRTGPGEVSEG